MLVDRIVMVEPESPGKHIYSRYLLPRLGLAILGTIAKRRGHRVEVFIEQLHRADLSALTTADLLCISTITSTAPAAYRLADEARRASVPVVIGGPHATFMPDEAIEHADWVIRGEAERSFEVFLDMLAGRASAGEVSGLSHRVDGQVVHNPLSAEAVDMDEVPIVDFSLIRGTRSSWFDRGIVPVQTSRGCPHKCIFCSVTPMFGRRVRFASPERVAEQLECHRGRGDMVFFYDDNFCASPGRTKRLLDHLMTRDVFLPSWIAQVSVRAARDAELLDLMKRAGCHTVFVGFESVQPETLRQYHKQQDVEDVRQAVRTFHRHGIRVHGMFMTGSDSEDAKTIRATARFAIREKIESIQFLLLTPLPGTPLFDDFETRGRLLTRDWSLYDTHHAVFRPRNMTPHDLMNETFAAMARVYSARRILGRLVSGDFHSAAIGLYARRLIRRWRRDNRRLLSAARRGRIVSHQTT